MRVWMLCVGIAGMAGLLGAAAPVDAVRLEQRGAHLIVDGVRINGRGPFRFLLDTGAESTVVTPETAQQLGLQPSYRVEVVTVNGTEEGLGRKVGRVEVGEMWVEGVEVLWYSLDGVKGVDSGIVGVLGQNVLRALGVYTIDRVRGVLVVGGGSGGVGERFPLVWIGGRPAVELDGMVLVVDSGAPALVLFREKVDGYRRTGGARMGSSSGGDGRMVSMGRLRRLWRLRDVETALLGVGKGASDGLLPVMLFDSVTVDADGGWVVLRVSGSSDGVGFSGRR